MSIQADFLLGGLRLRINAERHLRLTPEFEAFLAKQEGAADITAHITWDWQAARHPSTPPVGKDLLQIYYEEPDFSYCEVTGGDRNAVSCTCYNSDFSVLECAINTVDFDVPQDTVRQIVRMLPMRKIFLGFGVLFLHAAEIFYQGKGILFSAPSGTGKTTQAKLWRDYRGAEILCNDRTLIRKTERGWQTYGYPNDGSEPARNGKICGLGCIVLLEQAELNEIMHLAPSKAAARLMNQAVIDCWDEQSKRLALQLILQVLEDVPVYLLRCTVGESAVALLEETLQREEVWNHG